MNFQGLFLSCSSIIISVLLLLWILILVHKRLSCSNSQWFHRKFCRGEKGTVWRNALALHRGAQVLSGSSDVLFLQLALVFLEAKSLEFSGCPCCFVFCCGWYFGYWMMLDVIRHWMHCFFFTYFCIALVTGETYRTGLHQHLGWVKQPECPAVSSCQVANMNPRLDHSRLYCCPGCLWKSLPVAPCVMATGCAWRKRGNWHLQLCNQLLDLIMLHCNQVGISRFISVFCMQKRIIQDNV